MLLATLFFSFWVFATVGILGLRSGSDLGNLYTLVLVCVALCSASNVIFIYISPAPMPVFSALQLTVVAREWPFIWNTASTVLAINEGQ